MTCPCARRAATHRSRSPRVRGARRSDEGRRVPPSTRGARHTRCQKLTPRSTAASPTSGARAALDLDGRAALARSQRRAARSERAFEQQIRRERDNRTSSDRRLAVAALHAEARRTQRGPGPTAVSGYRLAISKLAKTNPPITFRRPCWLRLARGGRTGRGLVRSAGSAGVLR